MSSLHFHRWGPEPARVLLIHGITSSGATMWQLGEALADRGVVAPDLLGHGESPDADRYTVADLAAGLGSGYELVVGHSLGGFVAAHAAAHDPGFAQRLVLLDPALEIPDSAYPSVVENLVGEARNPPSEAQIRAENPSWHAETVRAKALAGRQARAEAVERILSDNAPWHHAHLLDRVTVPTLILAAEHDAVAPPTLARPHVEYRVVPGTGHSVHRDRPDLVLQAI